MPGVGRFLLKPQFDQERLDRAGGGGTTKGKIVGLSSSMVKG